MVTVYIVDDEDNIREGLALLIDWSSFGMTVIGSAGSGSQALPAILAMNPDVLITDVVMPRMNGIEMVSQLRNQGWPGEVLFMSAYQEMDYVKSAFKLAAADYLFKPIQDDEFNTVMHKVVRQVQEWKSKQSLLQEARLAVETQSLDHFWKSCLHPAAEPNQADVQWPDLLPDRQDISQFGLLLIHSHQSGRDLMKHVEVWQLKATKRQSGIWAFTEGEQEIAVIILFGWDEPADPAARLQELAQQMERHLFPYFQDLLIITGDLADTTEQLGTAFQAVKSRLAWHGFLQQDHLPIEPAETSELNDEVRQKWASRLADAILSPDPAEIPRILRQILANVLTARIDRIDEIRTICLIICTMMGEEIKTRANAPVLEHFFHQIAGMGGSEYVDDIYRQLLAGCIALNRELATDGCNTLLIRNIKRFVAQRLADVDIPMLASQLNFSKNHLANQFKRATGKTLMDYITEERMQQAARLLAETDQYIYEIALAVGYKDVAYFSKLFRKTIGQLPNQVREGGMIRDAEPREEN